MVGGAELVVAPDQLKSEMVHGRERHLDHVQDVVITVAGHEGDEIL